jgi:hypothetical protein
MSEPTPPTADPVFDTLRDALERDGPGPAVERLCHDLRERGDLGNLFYALLMKKRLELGVPPFPTGSSAELPESVHAEYEEAIRHAGRLVGGQFLERGEIARAWSYFRMLSEPEPVAKALEWYKPREDEDAQPVIDVAFQQGVHPRRGFELILDRYGVCSAITMLSGYDFPHGPEVKRFCIAQLTQALYDQLRERVRNEVVAKGEDVPADAGLAELMRGRDWLFGDDSYHIDVSHLSSVVQMAADLTDPADLARARELCDYGERLSPQFQYEGAPPFERTYHDIGVFIDVLRGVDVEKGLDHFRAKLAQCEGEDATTFPAEVFVNLLLRVGREAEALAVARKYLATADERQLSCPGVFELSRRVKDYPALSEAARERNDPVNFLAGLIAARGR